MFKIVESTNLYIFILDVCAPGYTAMPDDPTSCSPCPIGQYSPNGMACVNCPGGTTTLRIASTSRDHCGM